MKKFSIKTLFIVLMIAVLAFSLVACDKDPVECETCVDEDGDRKCDVCGKPVRTGGGNGANSDSAKFFQNLWDTAAPIGGTAIEDGEDLAVSMDMSLALGNGGDVLADLGVNIGLVLDRTTEGAHSAAKINVYDHENGDNLLTVYYFLDDNKTFYIDALGQSFKMAVDYNYNDDAAAIINDALNAKLSDLLGDAVNSYPGVAAKSIMDIINNLVDDFGASWNLDAPINAITGLLGVNIGELLGSNAELLDTVNGVLGNLATSMGIEDYEGIDTEALADSDAVILDLLKGVGPILFPQVKTTEDGNAITYKTGLDLTETGLIGKIKFLVASLPMGLGQVISDLEEVSLQYTTVDNVIDNFGINVSLGTDDDSIDLAIRINDMAIEGVNAAQAATVLGADKASYKPYFEVNTGMEIEITEDTLVVSLEGRDALDFAGTYTMALRGQIDLINDESKNETNNTRVYAFIKHNDKEIARLTFNNKALALGVDATSPVVQFIVEEGVSLLLQNLAEANQVDGQPDTWLRGFVLALANVAYVEDFADAAAIKAATSFTINPDLAIDNGVAISDITLADIKTHGVRLLEAAGSAIGGLLGGGASAETPDVEEVLAQVWQPNIYSLLTAISEAVDGNLKDGINVEIENIGEMIVSLFERTDDGYTGPLSIEELCYGNGETEAGKKVVGLFSMVDGFDAKTFATETFGQCDWAGEDILVSLMSSKIKANFNSDLDGTIEIINGDCSIKITMSAGITASNDAIDWTGYEFPDTTTWPCYELN